MAPHRRKRQNSILAFSVFLFLFGLAVSPTYAATWHVARDGSGDFIVIQEAVDAADDGDTIMLGPGRFSETSDFPYYYGRTIQACIALEKSLTFIGAGQGQTFIGPEESTRDRNQFGTAGIASISDNLELVVQDLTFIDCDGISLLFHMGSGGRIQLTRIGCEDTYLGIAIKGIIEGTIGECLFRNVLYDGINCHGGTNLVVSGCSFLNCGRGFNFQFPQTTGNTIENCLIQGGSGTQLSGILLASCGATNINNCTIMDTGNYGVLLTGTSGIQITNTTVGGDVGAGIALGGGGNTRVQNSVFEGTFCAVGLTVPPPGLDFHDNHILSGTGGWAVWAEENNGSITELDFTNNYWGTTDPDEVAASIWDRNDDPAIRMTIDFQPMADGPISTESKTLDQVKAL